MQSSAWSGEIELGELYVILDITVSTLRTYSLPLRNPAFSRIENRDHAKEGGEGDVP